MTERMHDEPDPAVPEGQAASSGGPPADAPLADGGPTADRAPGEDDADAPGLDSGITPAPG